MTWQWPIGGKEPFWLGPAAVGVLMILIGFLLFVWPQLLAFVVATIFICIGIAVLGFAWSLRRRVTYRRVDESSPQHIEERD
jgi:hypothetical protein